MFDVKARSLTVRVPSSTSKNRALTTKAGSLRVRVPRYSRTTGVPSASASRITVLSPSAVDA
jgi:hypothetical protein